MALVDVGTDQWLRDHESCMNLYMRIINELSDRDSYKKNTESYNSINAAALVHSRQFSNELDQLIENLQSSFTLTLGEKERRKRLIEDLKSKQIHMEKSLANRTEPAQLASTHTWSSSSSYRDDPDDEPLLGASIDELKSQQATILQRQDEGLDRLSGLISKQKSIAITINNEVDLHNDLIDNIGTRMDSTHARMNAETVDIRSISRSDSTTCYWLIIIMLFCAIISVSLI